MYVISETITSANQIFTYDITSIPALAVDHSWKIESVNSIPDGSSCLVADASIVDKNTFTLKPCNADFSAYVLINLVFLDKVKTNRRRRAIELRVDFTTHYIDKAIYITAHPATDANLTVHFREPGGEFHYCIVGVNDPLPDITGDWKTVTGVTSVRMTGNARKMWIYTTKNEKYSVSAPIHVEIDDTNWDPVTGNDKGYDVGGNIYGLLAGGKIGKVAALENVFANENIVNCGSLELSETNLTEGCYLNLFANSGLWDDGASFYNTLPATVVPSHAYYKMFSGIRYLNGPSSISASVLTGTHNFTSMFQDCNYINEYPKDLKPLVLTPYCYAYMFNASDVNPSEITIMATEYAEGCFKSMFAACTGIPNGIWSQTKPYSHASICERNGTRTLPTITATDFYEHSFERSFADCRYIYASMTLTMNIHKALERAFNEAFTLEYYSSISGTFPSINTFINTYTGEIELGTDAFSKMFYCCKNLNSVKNMSLASRSDAQNAYRNWLSGCSSTGTYTYNYYLLEYAYPTYTQADAETLIRSDYYIPSGWNIVMEDPVTRDYTFEFATGYPETIDGSLGNVNIGFIIGDGYVNYDRKLTINCKNKYDASIFYNEYIINSGSYTETPYIVRINPNITQNDWNFDVSASLTFYRFGGGIGDVKNITQNVSMPVDSSLMWETGYPRLVTEDDLGAIDLSLYIGDCSNGCIRTLNVVCKDYNNSATLFSQTYNITGSYTETPYKITINPVAHSYDWSVTLIVTATFGSIQKTIYGEVSLPIDRTFSWGTNYPSLAVDGSLGTVNLGYLVGDGYPEYDRVLTVTATDQDNTTLATKNVTLSRSDNYTQNPYTLSFDTLAYPDTTKVNIDSTIVFNGYGTQKSAYLDTQSFTIPLPEFDYIVSKGSNYCKWTQLDSTSTSITGNLTVDIDIRPGCPTGKKIVKNKIYMYDSGDKIVKRQTYVYEVNPSSTTETLQYDINITFTTDVIKLKLESAVHFRDTKDTKDLHTTIVFKTVSV